MSSLAGVTCECGWWIALHRDDSGEPSSWTVMDPANPLVHDDDTAMASSAVELALSSEGPVTIDVSLLQTALLEALARQASFTPKITCACGRTYKASRDEPYIIPVQ